MKTLAAILLLCSTAFANAPYGPPPVMVPVPTMQFVPTRPVTVYDVRYSWFGFGPPVLVPRTILVPLPPPRAPQ